MGAGVDQESTGESGLELRQLPEGGSLDGAPLDRVQVRHIALLRAERLAKRLEQGQRISFGLGCQHRSHGLVS